MVVKINSTAETKKDVIHSTVKMKRRKKAGSVAKEIRKSPLILAPLVPLGGEGHHEYSVS